MSSDAVIQAHISLPKMLNLSRIGEECLRRFSMFGSIQHEVGDVQKLALLIVDRDGKGLRSDNHWRKTAYSLLVGCILHLCYKAKVKGMPATFGALEHILFLPRRSSRSCFPPKSQF
jgi:type IV secretory pathway TraG/TraD family ATPase VirD4